MDSLPGRLDLLPALPEDWHEGRIEGIRARGNIGIQSLEWTRNNMKAVIVSSKSQTIEVHVPGEASPRRIRLEAGKPMMIEAKRSP